MSRVIRILDTALMTVLVYLLAGRILRSFLFTSTASLWAWCAALVFLLYRALRLKRQEEKDETQAQRQSDCRLLRQSLLLMPEVEYRVLLTQVIRADWPDARRLSRSLFLAPDRLIVLAGRETKEVRTLAVVRAMQALHAHILTVYAPLNESLLTHPDLAIEGHGLAAVAQSVREHRISYTSRSFPHSDAPRAPLLQRLRRALTDTHPGKYLLYAFAWVAAAVSGRFGRYYMLFALLYTLLAMRSFYLRGQRHSSTIR